EAIQDGKGSCRFRLRRDHGDTESDALADRPRNSDRTESHRRANQDKDNRPSVGYDGLFHHQASDSGVESVMFLPAARGDYSGSRGEPSRAKAMGLYL